jgi:hypothetical protein
MCRIDVRPLGGRRTIAVYYWKPRLGGRYPECCERQPPLSGWIRSAINGSFPAKDRCGCELAERRPAAFECGTRQHERDKLPSVKVGPNQ